MRIGRALIVAAGFVPMAAAAQAQGLVAGRLQDRANGVLAVLGVTAVPDSTTSSLSIRSEATEDPRLNQTQFGGAATISDEWPIYLEGFVGASRYDPTFIFSAGQDQRRLPTRWTGLAATGGVGWDFPIAPNLVFRPIVNVSLGYVTSDLNVAQLVVDGPELSFLDGGQLFAGGVGGSAMLDYELARPDYEIDVEARFTHLHLQSVAADDAAEGSADTRSVALWSRLRIPTGGAAFGRPLRYVFEAAHSYFLSDEVKALGFEHLTQVGFGLELDTEVDEILVTRTRLVGRYLFGDNVSGFTVGVGISF